MIKVTGLNLVFLWKITIIHGEYIRKIKQKKKLDREDVTAKFHDFQEPICLSVTGFPPLKCHDFKIFQLYVYKISMGVSLAKPDLFIVEFVSLQKIVGEIQGVFSFR